MIEEEVGEQQAVATEENDGAEAVSTPVDNEEEQHVPISAEVPPSPLASTPVSAVSPVEGVDGDGDYDMIGDESLPASPGMEDEVQVYDDEEGVEDEGVEDVMDVGDEEFHDAVEAEYAEGGVYEGDEHHAIPEGEVYDEEGEEEDGEEVVVSGVGEVVDAYDGDDDDEEYGVEDVIEETVALSDLVGEGEVEEEEEEPVVLFSGRRRRGEQPADGEEVRVEVQPVVRMDEEDEGVVPEDEGEEDEEDEEVPEIEREEELVWQHPGDVVVSSVETSHAKPSLDVNDGVVVAPTETGAETLPMDIEPKEAGNASSPTTISPISPVSPISPASSQLSTTSTSSHTSAGASAGEEEQVLEALGERDEAGTAMGVVTIVSGRRRRPRPPGAARSTASSASATTNAASTGVSANAAAAAAAAVADAAAEAAKKASAAAREMVAGLTVESAGASEKIVKAEEVEVPAVENGVEAMDVVAAEENAKEENVEKSGGGEAVDMVTDAVGEKVSTEPAASSGAKEGEKDPHASQPQPSQQLQQQGAEKAQEQQEQVVPGATTPTTPTSPSTPMTPTTPTTPTVSTRTSWGGLIRRKSSKKASKKKSQTGQKVEQAVPVTPTTAKEEDASTTMTEVKDAVLKAEETVAASSPNSKRNSGSRFFWSWNNQSQNQSQPSNEVAKTQPTTPTTPSGGDATMMTTTTSSFSDEQPQSAGVGAAGAGGMTRPSHSHMRQDSQD
ncbi:hypothetical protein HK102_008511, partial [Quaeritorhiza haematococci]